MNLTDTLCLKDCAEPLRLCDLSPAPTCYDQAPAGPTCTTLNLGTLASIIANVKPQREQAGKVVLDSSTATDSYVLEFPQPMVSDEYTVELTFQQDTVLGGVPLWSADKPTATQVTLNLSFKYTGTFFYRVKAL